MELEEIKENWQTMSHRIEKLEMINKQTIMEITQQKFKNKYQGLFNIEMLGTVICYIMAFVIFFNFAQLDTLVLQVCGVILMGSLIVMPFITISAILNLKRMDLFKSDQKSILQKFEKHNKRLLLYNKLSLPFAVIVFFLTMPVINRIMGNEDFFERLTAGRYIFIALVLVGVIAFSIYSYRCYQKISKNAEKLIKDFEE